MAIADRHQGVICLTWAQLHQDVRSLAAKLANTGPYKGIVVVARGGLAPAGILSKECNIHLLETVCIRSCETEPGSPPEARVIKTFSQDEGQGWLVLDDMAATGRTTNLLRAMLPKARIAAIYAKPPAIAKLDFFVVRVPQDAWLLFPWDAHIPTSLGGSLRSAGGGL